MSEQTQLAARLRAAYERCKSWPEDTPAGQIALLEIRNMVPELIAALERQTSDEGALRTLAAVVLAAGGAVEVKHRDLIRSDQAEVTISDTPEGGVTITATTRRQGDNV